MGKQERNRKVYFDFVGDEKSHKRRERKRQKSGAFAFEFDDVIFRFWIFLPPEAFIIEI